MSATPSDPAAVASSGYLGYLPASLFGSVMGLTGLSIVWATMHSHFGAPSWIAHLLAVLAGAAFVVLGVAYAIKAVTAPAAVSNELNHPVAVNMFATFWVSLLLLPLVVAPYSRAAGTVIWLIGAVGMMVFALYIVNRWLSKQHQMAHAAPAWILPVVGLLDMPLAVPLLDIPNPGALMSIGMAIGFFFAIPLFTLVFSRLVFEAPIPAALEPSLMILVAPFAVGMSTYLAVTARMDLFARSLYVLTVFMVLVLMTRLRHLPQCCPFRVGWWAVSFPLAASALAALKFELAHPAPLTKAVAFALVGLATAVIGWMLVRTLHGVARGELRTLTT